MRQHYKLTAPRGSLSISSTGTDNIVYTEVTLSGSGAVSTTIPDTTSTIVMQTQTASVSTDAYIEYDGGETLIDKWGGSLIGPGQYRVFNLSQVTSSGGYPKLKLNAVSATAPSPQVVHLWFYS